jgi:hypothetical protein
MTTRPLALLRRVALAPLALLLLLGLPLPADAFERGPYSVEILVDGVALPEYAARDRTYVEALEGHEYSIRLSNRTGRRIAIALSVDGLNSIDAKTTTAKKASKWILDPHETITLDGWQTSSSVARRFFFTTEEKSYGAWLGKTRNLGIISAAVFREKLPEPQPLYQPGEREEKSPARKDEGGRDAPAAGAPTERSKSTRSRPPSQPQQELSDEMAATGIGREVGHRVRRIRFDAESSPAAVMEIRYEYHDELVRLGVLPRPFAYREDPLGRRERARGFEDIEFAPDPYR